jgi:hypothetical protein
VKFNASIPPVVLHGGIMIRYLCLSRILIALVALLGSLGQVSEAGAQDVTFRQVSVKLDRLVLEDCSFVNGQTKVIVKRRGRVVALPRSAQRRSYRLPTRYAFFACQTDATTGQSVLYVKATENGEVSQFALTAADFPTIESRGIPEATCKEFPGSIFKPCICADQVPSDIQYRSSLSACGGNAAAILKGGYADSFSVVLRDSQNRDRWPASGYNGCTAGEVEEGLAKCSAFKCQKTVRSSDQYICCFGEPGSSSIMAGATRLTIKLADHPGSTTDPLLRLCLPGFDPTSSLN